MKRLFILTLMSIISTTALAAPQKFNCQLVANQRETPTAPYLDQVSITLNQVADAPWSHLKPQAGTITYWEERNPSSSSRFVTRKLYLETQKHANNDCWECDGEPMTSPTLVANLPWGSSHGYASINLTVTYNPSYRNLFMILTASGMSAESTDMYKCNPVE